MSAGSLLQALVHAALFAAAALWAFDLGYQVAGGWLGMLMGLNAGVFAVLMASGLLDRLRRLRARAPVADPSRTT